MHTKLIEALTEATLNEKIKWSEDTNISHPLLHLWSCTYNGVTANLYENNTHVNKYQMTLTDGNERLIFSDVYPLVYAIKNRKEIVKSYTMLERFIIGIRDDIHKNKEH